MKVQVPFGTQLFLNPKALTLALSRKEREIIWQFFSAKRRRDLLYWTEF